MPSARSIRRTTAIAAVVLVVIVFVPPFFQLKVWQARIVGAISYALGRPASISSVSLHLFPQPGFDLKGLVVQDDPAFSAEPLLRADEVSANLRLSSMWRWRLEIGSLSLKSPSGGQPWSLNVVRSRDGRWNLASLLTHASQTPSAPTAKPRPESRPRFPYIEGDGGRINFKSGIEKKAYALNEADFALWLASENEWNMRLSARPMRTDANLSDTGTIEMSGAVGRAPRLDEMPLRLRIVLRGAQLGQLTRLIYGRDRGWRGSVNATADLTGTTQDLGISASGSVDDFRRYDIIIQDTLRLEARCVARYRWQAQELSGLECQGQNGAVVARGSVSGLPGMEKYDLLFTATNVPMAEITRAARHAKFALPSDLTASGNLDAEFTCQTATQPGSCQWAGAGTTRAFVLRSGVLGQELRLNAIKFAMSNPESKPVASAGQRGGDPKAAIPAEPRLMVAAFPLMAGGATPVIVRATLSRAQYSVELRGDAELQRLFRLAHALGLRAPAGAATGNAKVELEIAGNWSGFTAPVATGTMQLHNVIVPLKGVATPAHVRAATATLLPEEVQLQNLAVSFGSNRTTADGSLTLPRICESSQPCMVGFDLHSSELDVDELNRLLNPRLQRVPWYRMLVSDSTTSLSRVQAHGRMRVDRLVLKGLQLDHAVAQAELNNAHLRLSDFHGGLLGGKVRGEVRADFSGDVPTYTGGGSLERVSISQLSALTHRPLGTGTAGGEFTLELSGWSASDVAQSAQGSVEFDWHDGALPQMLLVGGPLRFRHFTGRGTLRNGRVEFAQSKIETPDGIYVVSGTASPELLDLKLVGRASHGYAVSGTLDKPHVAPLTAAQTQAALGK